MKLFFSYARPDRERADSLAQRLRQAGNEVWLDSQLTGGRAWWDTILHQVRNCDALVMIVSWASIKSQACMNERIYATQLGKTVLPVAVEQIRAEVLPPDIGRLQVIDYSQPSETAAFLLIGSVMKLPPPPPLPDPLPEPPSIPISYLSAIADRLSRPDLTRDDQFAIVGILEDALGSSDLSDQASALQLLGVMEGRTDLLAAVDKRIAILLKNTRQATGTSESAESAAGTASAPSAGTGFRWQDPLKPETSTDAQERGSKSSRSETGRPKREWQPSAKSQWKPSAEKPQSQPSAPQSARPVTAFAAVPSPPPPPDAPGGPPTVTEASARTSDAAVTQPQVLPPRPQGQPPRRGSAAVLTRRQLLGALIALALVGAGVGVGLRLHRTSATSGELFLQPANSAGSDPFTPNVGSNASVPGKVSSAPVSGGSSSVTIRSYSGNTVGLYGGTQSLTSCNSRQMIRYLEADPAKAAAWGTAEGISASKISSYISGLTPMTLRYDTRITNHGFVNGQANPIQEVLQAGQAVLVDSHGVPRARCYCGNPLTPPISMRSYTYVGQRWAGFSPATVILVQHSTTVINNFTLIDNTTGAPFNRPTRTSGHQDGHARPSPNQPTMPGLTPSSTPPSSTPSSTLSPTPSSSTQSSTPSSSTQSSTPPSPTPSPTSQPTSQPPPSQPPPSQPPPSQPPPSQPPPSEPPPSEPPPSAGAS